MSQRNVAKYSLRSLISFTTLVAVVLATILAVFVYWEKRFVVTETTAVLERMGWAVTVLPRAQNDEERLHPPRELKLGSNALALHVVNTDEAFVASRTSNVVRLVFENCELSKEVFRTIEEEAKSLREIVLIDCTLGDGSLNEFQRRRPEVAVEVIDEEEGHGRIVPSMIRAGRKQTGLNDTGAMKGDGGSFGETIR